MSPARPTGGGPNIHTQYDDDGGLQSRLASSSSYLAQMVTSARLLDGISSQMIPMPLSSHFNSDRTPMHTQSRANPLSTSSDDL